MIGPRRLVYLDSAVINEIADGKTYPPASVETLHAAMRDVGATLVVSFAHLADFTHSTDEATRRRVSKALDAFPAVAFAAADPTKDEKRNLEAFGGLAGDAWKRPKAELSPDGLQLQALKGFDALLRGDWKLALTLCGLELVLGLMRFAESLGKAAARRDTAAREAAGDPAASKRERERAKGYFVSITDGLATFGIPQVAAMRSDKLWKQLTNKTGMAESEFAGASIRGDDAQRAKVMAWLSPGLALLAAVAREHLKDPRREPLYSDRPDLWHMKYVPYVDLATVDGANHAVVSRTLKTLRCVGLARVERNPPTNAGAEQAIAALAGNIRSLGTAG